MQERYSELQAQHEETYSKLNKQYNIISYFRFAIAIIIILCLYYYVTIKAMYLLVTPAVLLAIFVFLMRNHLIIYRQRALAKALAEVNSDELAFLKKEKIPYADGAEFNDGAHLYANDLDVFGTNSIFQNINRTATYIGKSRLAKLLLNVLNKKEIEENQAAVSELSEKLDWRQRIFALARIINDNKIFYHKLIKWTKTAQQPMSALLSFFSYLSPLLFLSLLIIYGVTGEVLYTKMATFWFFVNLAVLVFQLKNIKEEVLYAEKEYEILKSYSSILLAIEQETFASAKLIALKSKLACDKGLVSDQVQKISSLLDSMNSIQNPIGAAIFNGIGLYHLHVLRKIRAWKKAYSAQIPLWLEVLGEVEVLNSLANFAYNNPQFCFPTLNEQEELTFSDLGHPLIRAEKRICNSIQLKNNRFVILTGSNMSGKSTFLRTLGANMLLALIGSKVCARAASVQPMPILVSMKIMDSLNENESYFFAEIKRLKEIMDIAKEQVCFILLDEILRGTNSDDKQNGTLEVIKKMVKHRALGAIATHDLEVCAIANEYGETLTNKCFEVEIVNDELAFDYKLREGICKNKSATFLMKKMGII